jgi:hypothetical protein
MREAAASLFHYNEKTTLYKLNPINMCIAVSSKHYLISSFLIKLSP